jgi:predicted ATP-dependent endonuclease of OLD family
MKLKQLYVRFFKSFNYDFDRKVKGGPRSKWEESDPIWYPYVRIEIENLITAIVGSNEAGKSQLLKAIKKAYGALEIEREDFCRYSALFSIESGKEKWSEFGLSWSDFTDKDKEVVKEIIDPSSDFTTLQIFRIDKDILKIYFDEKPIEAETLKVQKILDIMPAVFGLKNKLKVPDSIPLSFLYSDQNQGFSQNILTSITQLTTKFAEEIASGTSPSYSAELQKLLKKAIEEDQLNTNLSEDQVLLMRTLVCDVAKISPDYLKDLDAKIGMGHKAGYIEGIISEISKRLNDSLNIPSFWRQDSKFQIRVTRGGAFLNFVIRDRTNTDYSFDERSDGLQYFLSYYIQYLEYKQKSGKEEILLMDEPDAYLSALAQQDLLKVFEKFATPERQLYPVQVIYVTHSPFLIDRNHPERVRVIDKGSDDTGTRVIEGASNHYEPLRSAFGLAIGETAFIGNSNLIVEGISDQILIVGISTLLANDKDRTRSEYIDLNRITVNDGGGAQNVPHTVFLSRGRDAKKPVVTVLLDNDDEGREVANKLSSKEAIINIYNSKFTSYVTEGSGNTTIEDLVPPKLLIEASRRLQNIFDRTPDSLENLLEKYNASVSIGIVKLKEIFKPFEISKPALAKQILLILSDGVDKVSFSNEIQLLKQNFSTLFARLNIVIEDAEFENSKARIKGKLEGLRSNFKRDHTDAAIKEDGLKLIRDCRRVLDESKESTVIHALYDVIEKNFLQGNPQHNIENYTDFLREMSKVEQIVDKQQTAKEIPELISQISTSK